MEVKKVPKTDLIYDIKVVAVWPKKKGLRYVYAIFWKDIPLCEGMAQMGI